MVVSADSRSVERLVVELVVSSLPRCARAMFRAICALDEYAAVEEDVVAIVKEIVVYRRCSARLWCYASSL
jgi:hypothetical protein